MEDINCSQKALANCAVSTVQLASSVALSDHNDAIAAAFVRAMPHSVNFVWVIPFRTDDSPDIRVQRPAVRPPISNFLRARSQCSQATPLTTARCQNCHHSGHCPHRERQAAARRASPSLRDGTPAMRGLLIRYRLGRKPRRSHERSPVQGSALSLPFVAAPC